MHSFGMDSYGLAGLTPCRVSANNGPSFFRRTENSMVMECQPDSGPTPFAVALLLCDDVIVDERSKKKTLVGVFDQVLAHQFPVEHRPLTIYARLKDAEGQYHLRVEYVQVSTDRVLGRGDLGTMTIPSRLFITELVLTPPTIRIPEAGAYEFRIWANDRYIGRIAFEARQIPPEGGLT